MRTGAALKTGVAVTFCLSLLVLVPAAQATLTPRDGLNGAMSIDVESLYTGPAGAELERSYFTAPVEARAGVNTQATPAVETPHRAGRCTVKAIVFEKMRLAQACY